MSSQAPIPKYSLKQRIKLLSLGISKWVIPTYTTGSELLQLYQLSKLLPKSARLVEIGSYIGASSLMIAKGVSKNSILYCVDTWNNDAMTEGNWDTLAMFNKNTTSVSNRIKTIKSTSIEAAKLINEPLDFIFIDGDHSYEGVKADVMTWFPKLKQNGIIVMHDVGWAEGVMKVVEEDVKPHLNKFDALPNMFWGWKK